MTKYLDDAGKEIPGTRIVAALFPSDLERMLAIAERLKVTKAGLFQVPATIVPLDRLAALLSQVKVKNAELKAVRKTARLAVSVHPSFLPQLNERLKTLDTKMTALIETIILMGDGELEEYVKEVVTTNYRRRVYEEIPEDQRARKVIKPHMRPSDVERLDQIRKSFDLGRPGIYSIVGEVLSDDEIDNLLDRLDQRTAKNPKETKSALWTAACPLIAKTRVEGLSLKLKRPPVHFLEAITCLTDDELRPLVSRLKELRPWSVMHTSSASSKSDAPLPFEPEPAAPANEEDRARDADRKKVHLSVRSSFADRLDEIRLAFDLGRPGLLALVAEAMRDEEIFEILTRLRSQTLQTEHETKNVLWDTLARGSTARRLGELSKQFKMPKRYFIEAVACLTDDELVPLVRRVKEMYPDSGELVSNRAY